MAVTEERMESVLMSGPRLSPSRSLERKRLTPYFWARFIQGFAVMAVSAAICGGVAFERMANRAYLEMADKFSWMVLVTGDALQMDEVGRQLKLLPGARDVSLITSEEAFQGLQNDPLYLGDINSFEAADLPTSWRVHWDPRSVDFSLLPLFAEDVRRVSGVIDVAYDPRQLEMIHHLRGQRYAVLTALWTVGLVVALGALFLFGRLIFFNRSLRWTFATVGEFLFQDQIWWMGGFALAWKFLERAVPWPLLAGGLIIGFLHLSWESLEKR